MKPFTLLIFFFLVGISLSLAQEENKVIVDNEMKIQFSVPDDWKATKKGDRYLMGSPDTNGFMLIQVQNYSSLKKLKAAMEAGILLEDGSKMKPSSELTMLGKQGVSGMFIGVVDGTKMNGFLMALLAPSTNRAAICISVAPSNLFNQTNMDELKTLLRSVIFL